MVVCCLFRMDSIWLFVHYNGHDFDVRVEDDLCNLMGLYEDLFEEFVKSNVYLPKTFKILVHNLRTNTKIEISIDADLGRYGLLGGQLTP